MKGALNYFFFLSFSTFSDLQPKIKIIKKMRQLQREREPSEIKEPKNDEKSFLETHKKAANMNAIKTAN